MTALNARAHEVRHMLESEEFCIVRPVSPATCEVLGYKVSASSPAWSGLMFEHPSLFVTGAKMHVPFLHPEDAARGIDWDEAFYAVRPIYAPGDSVVVKETWNIFQFSRDMDDCWQFSNIPKDDPRLDETARASCVVDYKTCSPLDGDDAGKGPFRSATQMPHWASRLTLTVTDVQVKRVQDVTEEEARQAGAVPVEAPPGILETNAHHHALRRSWNQHHPKTPWDSNPWVIVARCKVHRCNVSQLKSEAA